MEIGNSHEVCAAILCTSGSSGVPKLAKISHAQYLQPFTLNQFYENTFSLNFSSLYWVRIVLDNSGIPTNRNLFMIADWFL